MRSVDGSYAVLTRRRGEAVDSNALIVQALDIIQTLDDVTIAQAPDVVRLDSNRADPQGRLCVKTSRGAKCLLFVTYLCRYMREHEH